MHLTHIHKTRYVLFKLLTLKSAVLWMDSDLQFAKVPELLRTDPSRRPIDLGVVNNKPFWMHTIWDGYSMCVSSHAVAVVVLVMLVVVAAAVAVVVVVVVVRRWLWSWRR
jgi:hypothetical protein